MICLSGGLDGALAGLFGAHLRRAFGCPGGLSRFGAHGESNAPYLAVSGDWEQSRLSPVITERTCLPTLSVSSNIVYNLEPLS